MKKKAPQKTAKELIAEWLKTTKVTTLEMDAFSPKEEQGGYGFGRGRRPRAKAPASEE
jgi:hypothetical protein